MGMSGGGGGGGLNSEINVTPMVDIMLVLLIIFMVITPLLQSGVTVNIPKEMRSPDEDQAIVKESSVVIALTNDGKFYIGKDEVKKAEIATEVKRKMEKKPPEDQIVYIKADVGSSYGELVKLIDIIRSPESGSIQQIGLVADKRKGRGAAPTQPVPQG